MQKELNNSIVIEFDQEDNNLIEEYNWKAVFNKFYWDIRYHKKINGKSKEFHLNRVMLNIDDPKIRVVFRDGNRLNFRRNNLMIESFRKNRPNVSAKKTSSFFGVEKKSYSLKDGSTKIYWTARITFNKITISIGSFKSEIKAAKAYNKKAIELHGDRAVLNEI